MKDKKILFLCQYFYPEKISSGVLPFELASSLAGKGYDVSALVGYPKEYSDFDKINMKEKIYDISIRRIRYFQTNRSNFIGRLLNYFGFILSIIIHPFKFLNNDIYICYTNPPLLPFIVAFYKKILNKKMIMVIYDLYPDIAVKLKMINENGLIVNMFNRLNKFVYKNVDQIVVLSSEMKTYLIENKNISPKKITIIPNWYKKLEIRNTNFECHEIIVFYGGNMGLAQDMETLEKTMILLKDNKKIKFYFVGHGVKKDEVIQIKKKYNLNNCIIFDFLPKDKYEELMVKADIMVVSLEKSAKGLGSPSKVYSYLSAGKPILAIMPKDTDVVTDIEQYQNGYHIKNGDVEYLKEIILTLNKEDLHIKGIQSYKLFNDKYTLEKCSNQYIELIRKGLKNESI